MSGVIPNLPRAAQLCGAREVGFLISATRENTLYLSGVDCREQETFPHTAEAYAVASAAAAGSPWLVLPAARSGNGRTGWAGVRGTIPYGVFARPAEAHELLSEEERDVLDIGEHGRANSLEAIAAALELLGIGTDTVAVDERGPRRDLLERLSERFPLARFVPGAQLLREIRAVKTDAEIALIREATRCNEAGFRAVFDALEPGVRESALIGVFRAAVRAQGAEPGHCLLRFGRRMAMLFDAVGEAILNPGETVFLDAGATVQGYRSDLGRLVAFGAPPERARRMYAASLAGQSLAIEQLRVGRPVSEVFRAAVTGARENGNPDFSRHHTGHAVGLEWNDEPMITADNPAVLEAGMVLTVELPYYRLGFGGAHIEDMLLVTRDGPERLSTLERPLQVYGGG